MRARILPCSMLLLLASGCAHAPSEPAVRRGTLRSMLPSRVPLDAFDERGRASWYGRAHHGKRTASGEAFDMNDFTAAHRTLPFGTRVVVTNLDNGRWVEVRINDRGPFRRSRILDLSYEAAKRLGAIGGGVIPVTLKVLPSSGSD
jgi:rare lipoprotein A